MQIQNKLNDDVIGVIKTYVSDIDRFNHLRQKYTNGFLTSGLQRKNHYQLQLIHSKLIEMIHHEDFEDICLLFNTIGIEWEVIEAMKHNPEPYLKLKYYNYWKTWNSKETKDEKIKKIVDVFQRLCDIVNLKKIDCIGISRRRLKIKIRKLWIFKEYQSEFVEKATKFLLLLVSILKKTPVKLHK